MDALLQTVTHTIVRDFRELVQAARLDAHNDDTLVELEPPNYVPWWRLPLGFGSLAAAAALLVLVAGVQTRVKVHGATGQQQAAKAPKKHRRPLQPRPLPAPLDRGY